MEFIEKNKYDVIVIGGGASGMMAAIFAALEYEKLQVNNFKNDSILHINPIKPKILILEKNKELGKKLKITGGGRCNITNNQPDFRKFISSYGEAAKFLFTPFSLFGVKDTFEFFEKRGLRLILEDEHRVFPITQKAVSVFEILLKEINRLNIEIIYEKSVKNIYTNNQKISKIETVDGNIFYANSFILSTGGASHPETGSDGLGFKLLSSVGHNIISPDTSLVPLIVKNNITKSLSGISMNDISFKIFLEDKLIKKTKGKVLFTEIGLSGPGILNISKIVRENLPLGQVSISFDLLKDIEIDKTDKYILDIINNNHNKKIKNIKICDITESLWVFILSHCGIDIEKYCSELKKEDRIKIGLSLKDFRLEISGTLGADKSIVSSGGVDLREIDMKTMSSKLCDNLFVTGDLLNIDRPSGGYSLQLCWTTGAIAGKSTAQKIK